MKTNEERFIRWQSILRNQLTFLNNLLLAISIGILGYLFTLLNTPTFIITGDQKLFFTLGLFLLFISVMCGIFTAFNRLLDFRATTKKIRKKQLGSKQENLSELTELMELYGKITWFLFYSQIITLSISVFSLCIAFFEIYRDKLF